MAELSYFMAFNMPTNRARRRKGRPSRDGEEKRERGRERGGEEPSMIFISQPGEHIYCGLDKDGRRGWKSSAAPRAPDKMVTIIWSQPLTSIIYIS